MSELQNEDSQNASDEADSVGVIKRSRLCRKQTLQSKKICAKEERNASIKKVSFILQKNEEERTLEETQLLRDCSETVQEVHLRWRKRDEAKRRLEEFEDAPDALQSKCEILAQAIAQSQHLVIYTGAGISTAARIPDYRGTNGIWTRLQQGKDIGNHDLSLAEPTYTHMALSELYRRKILKYVVSQNCDGLHLRSGLPKTALSELHGNMYVEVCKSCKPSREYLRLFDVTENTARYSHKTNRKCYVCNGPLVDSIVHFGERGSLQWPLNWAGACKNAGKATTIICLGSSLKVLKKYPWLWQMDKPVKKRPNLYIVNLQWTPKDDCATAKIHGKCDRVMEIVMNVLGIPVPEYKREKDPIFTHATELCDLEHHTTSQPFLKISFKEYSSPKPEVKDCREIEIENKDLISCTHLQNTPSQPQQDCDNKSNIPNFKEASSSADRKEQTCSSFTIDRILGRDDRTNHRPSVVNNVEFNPFATPQFLYQSYQTFLAYYQFSSPQYLGYPDLFYYPYQTSLMYPGLHSIIKKEAELTYNKENILGAKSTNVVVKTEASCEFCCNNYDSLICLFYTKFEPAFVKKEFRFSKLESINKPNICICCDYSTDEDATSDSNESADKKTSSSFECNEAIEEEQKGKIQAGWFGKGYRKRRFKRRQNCLPP